MASRVSCGKGSPKRSAAPKPAGASCQEISAPAACNTVCVAAITSGPMPSPAILTTTVAMDSPDAVDSNECLKHTTGSLACGVGLHRRALPVTYPEAQRAKSSIRTPASALHGAGSFDVEHSIVRLAPFAGRHSRVGADPTGILVAALPGLLRPGLSHQRRLHGPRQLGHRPGSRLGLRLPADLGAVDVEL